VPVTPATPPATTATPAVAVPPAPPLPPDPGQTGGQQAGGQQPGNPQTGNPQAGNSQAGNSPAGSPQGSSVATGQQVPVQQTPAQQTPAQQTPVQQTGSQPGAASSSPSQAGGDAAAQISDSLRELAQGGAFTAQAVARDGAALLVRTAAGTTLSLTGVSAGLAGLLAQTDTALLLSALRLQLNPANPQQATITAVNGNVLPAPVAALAQPPTAAQLALAISPPQPGGGAAAALPAPGQALTAVVVPQPLQAGTAQVAALPPGSQLQLIVQSAAPPSAAPAQAAAPGPGLAAPPTAAQIAQQASHAGRIATPGAIPPGQPSALAGLPPAETAAGALPAVPSASAAAQAAALPAASAAPAPGASATAGLLPGQPGVPAVLTGIVTGQNQAGQTLLNTPQGLLALTLPQILPPGAQVTLELSALVRPAGTPATMLAPTPPAGVLSRLQGEWPLLQQTLDAIRAADPALAQRLQDQLLPQANARLAATALQFMAAAAAGSAQAWLGSEAVRKLQQQGKGDLLRRLDDDFRDLGRLNQREGDNQWQALVMPMMIGGRVEAIQIFMRRRRDPKRQQSQTRFIIDFNLESTGPIQFDGFVGTKQLDLILRSESEFGPAFRLDVTAIFEEAIAVTGLAGSIRFHSREKPLEWPSPELEARGPTTELKA
jgi:hypothetical protein